MGIYFPKVFYPGTHYHNRLEVQQKNQKINQQNKEITRLYPIAVSPGGHAVTILLIGSNLENVPAEYEGANFEENSYFQVLN